MEGVSAGYGRATVVSDVNLYADAGEVIALLGRNGAGKTTTLLALAGGIPTRSGRVWVDGQEFTGPLHRRAARGLGLLPEKRPIFRRLTVRQNLELGKGGMDAALAYAPELTRMLDRPAGVLSGGEQQLLCIARVIAAKPAVIAVDELSLGLAPIIVDRLIGLLRQAAGQGAAVVLVEQQVPHALAAADRVYIMNKGAVQHVGNVNAVSDIVPLLDDAYLGTSLEPRSGATMTNQDEV
jgi:branched-chain amino acid transport system ATP-binding protein